MYNYTSGRSAPKATIPLLQTSGTLLRSCRNCFKTDLHNYKLLHSPSQTFGTECPHCNLCQFKFEEHITDAVRNEISLELRGRMGPRLEQQGAYRDYAPKPVRSAFKGRAVPR